MTAIVVEMEVTTTTAAQFTSPKAMCDSRGGAVSELHLHSNYRACSNYYQRS